MGRVINHIQSVFTRGPLSKRMIGRVDNETYNKSLAACSNVLLLPQGCFTARSGTVYVNEVKDSADDSRLIEFRFNASQTYLIELGDNYARFYKDRSIIESGGSPYEVVTPWSASELKDLSYIQSGDVIFFFHRDYQPRSLGRISDTSWTLKTVEFRNGPWLALNDSVITIKPSATSGSVTLTASASLFVAGDVGRLVRYKDTSSADWGYAVITAHTSGTAVTATVKDAFPATTASKIWQLSLYGGSNKWPKIATIHEERFVVAGSLVFPFRGSCSQTGLYSPDYIDFAPSEVDGQVIDSNGFNFDLTADDVDDIVWLQSSRTLLVGTISSEYSVTGNGTASRVPLSPSDKLTKREATFGSLSNVRPIKIGNSTLYIDSSGLKVRELYYEYAIDSYLSKDSTVFNSDITKSGVVRTAFQKNPDPFMWMVLNNGNLVAFTFEKVNEVEGMHPHIVTRDGEKVLDIASIVRPNGAADDVYLLVERTIDGNAVKYIEYISPYFEEIEDIKEALFVDCAIEVVNGPASATVSGLDHLEGEEVKILADGSPHPVRTVSSGEITLNGPAEKIKVGLGYSKTIELLPPEFAQVGSIQGRVTRPNKGWIRLTNTVGLKVGTSYIDGLDTVPFNGTNNNLNQPAPLFNGVKVFYPPSGYEINNSIKLESDDPLPFMVNYVVQELEINN